MGDSVINSVADQILMAMGYSLTWALVEFVDWWTPIVLIMVLQIVSYAMGAGFLMVVVRALKSFCGKKAMPEPSTMVRDVSEL